MLTLYVAERKKKKGEEGREVQLGESDMEIREDRLLPKDEMVENL